LARNSNSNFVMQHEQKECSITVQTSEGHSIQWIKLNEVDEKNQSIRATGRDAE